MPALAGHGPSSPYPGNFCGVMIMKWKQDLYNGLKRGGFVIRDRSISCYREILTINCESVCFLLIGLTMELLSPLETNLAIPSTGYS